MKTQNSVINIIAVITKPKTSINIKKSNSSDTYQFSPQKLFIYIKKTLTNFKEDICRGTLSKKYKEFNSENTAEYISQLTHRIKLIKNHNKVSTSLMNFSACKIIVSAPSSVKVFE